MGTVADSSAVRPGIVAVCGNPNSGKTTTFNAITGLNQKVANYPGVTVEKVSGFFTVAGKDRRKYELVDVPGTYSLAAFSPDEYIAASALYGGIEGEWSPDVLICVVDATNLERGLYLLFQVMQINRPVVAALNMTDLAEKRGIKIDYSRLSQAIGGMPVVPVVANKGKGIERLKQEAARLVRKPIRPVYHRYDEDTEGLIKQLKGFSSDDRRTRAEYLRIIFDIDGPAERKLLGEVEQRSSNGSDELTLLLRQGRDRIKARHGSLSIAETSALTEKAAEVYRAVVTVAAGEVRTNSEKLDRYLLHPVLGPVFLLLMMTFVFQSIFSWAEPFMELIDTTFGSLARYVETLISEGPLCSFLTDGVIGGVGSVLIFLPQIVILFVFITLLEDSGYMTRAAFLVDRMFRWCGLSGKSFIPMLSSFACAVPGILATRTIEDRKLRFITIMVAPLMTCSARLPVYAIMIAAFVPRQSYFGLFNLQGLTLTMLYLLGIVAAVGVSFILQKTLLRTQRDTFMMEMPSYKLPTLKSVFIQVSTRARLFLVRAGTVILAITIIIWALTYYPHSQDVFERFAWRVSETNEQYVVAEYALEERLFALLEGISGEARTHASALDEQFTAVKTAAEIQEIYDNQMADGQLAPALIEALFEQRMLAIEHKATLARLGNERAGEYVRDSYLGRIGRAVEPLFRPLGWDWKITMAALSSFPAREVIIATLGTIYNLGMDIEAESSTLVDKMRQAVWESGPKTGEKVFSTAVALSIMVFFALSCQCGATLVIIKQETRRWSYSVFVFSYMTCLAYVASFAVYQFFDRLGF